MVRDSAVFALIGRGLDPQSKAALEVARNDPDPKVREMAADPDFGSPGIVVTTSVR